MSEVLKGIKLRTLTPEEQAERERERQEQAPAQAAQIAALLTEHMNTATQRALADAARAVVVPTLKDPETLATERQEREMNSSFLQFHSIRESQERVLRQAHERERQERERDRQALAAAIAAAHHASATPTPDPEPPKARPDAEPIKRKATESRDEALRDVIDAIESRAREVGHPFDRAQWPGTKAEFRAFLSWHNARLSYQLPADDSRLSDELRPLRVAFARPGRARDKGRKFYKALFPDYPA
jgi:hypothetical protein